MEMCPRRRLPAWSRPSFAPPASGRTTLTARRPRAPHPPEVTHERCPAPSPCDHRGWHSLRRLLERATDSRESLPPRRVTACAATTASAFRSGGSHLAPVHSERVDDNDIHEDHND